VGLVIGLLITISVPVGIIFLIHRRSRVPVAVPLIAALFALFGLALTVPFTAWIWPLAFGGGRMPGALLLGAVTTGVISEFARFLSFRYIKTMQFHRDHSGALAAGIGHAAVGSVLAGLQFLATFAVMTFLGAAVNPAQVRDTLANGGPRIIIQALGQLPLIACSLAFSVLVVLAFRRNWLFFGVAILAHVGVLASVAILPTYIWGQAVLGLFGGISLIFVFLVVRSNIIAPIPRAPEPEPVDHPARIS
jgi:YhfC intramembrane metalloprotease